MIEPHQSCNSSSKVKINFSRYLLFHLLFPFPHLIQSVLKLDDIINFDNRSRVVDHFLVVIRSFAVDPR